MSRHESGITNPIKVHQQIVLRSRKQDLPEWRGTAIHYTLEEIAPGRIRLESFCLETELTAVLFDLKIKRILDTWPEARRRTEAEKPENSSVDSVKTILFIASDPSDLSTLRLGTEVREISEKLQLAKLRTLFKLEQRHAARVTDLTQALLDTKPNIVHLSGHGTTEGSLCLQDSSGLAHPVPPDALGALFGQFAGNVYCVILNVCHSEAQAASIAKHIPYVIGMNGDIPDRASVAFSVGFYQALGAGSSIQEAHQLGCIQIALEGIPEHLTPILILRDLQKTSNHSLT